MALNPQVVRKIEAIKDEAVALGWPEDELLGEFDGWRHAKSLAQTMRPDATIVAVYEDRIEISHDRGASAVTLNRYRKNYPHPWIKREEN